MGQQQGAGAEEHYDGKEGVTDTDFTAGVLLILCTVFGVICLFWSDKR